MRFRKLIRNQIMKDATMELTVPASAGRPTFPVTAIIRPQDPGFYGRKLEQERLFHHAIRTKKGWQVSGE
jgi:hypothetical protein